MASVDGVPASRPRVRVGRVAFVALLVLVFLVTVLLRWAVNDAIAKGSMFRHTQMVLGYLEEFEPDSELEQRKLDKLEQKVREGSWEFMEYLERELWRSNSKHDMVLLGIVALLLVERITAVRRLRVSGSGRAPGGE